MRVLIRTLGALALVALLLTSIPAWRVTRADAAAAPALDPSDLDRSCKACDDFWRYATGGWQQRTKIPAGYPSWDSFSIVYERNLAALRSILDTAAGDVATTADPDERRIGVFYAACTDRTAIDARGLDALQPELDRIGGTRSVADLVAEISRLERLGVDAGLGFGSETDARDSSRTIAAVGYGGLGMPDRDNYLAPSMGAIRSAYVTYLTRQLRNLGEEPADATRHARDVMALETGFARATPPRADLRDPLATYHPTPVAHLAAIAPHVPWGALLASMSVPGLRSVDLNLPKFTAYYDSQLAAVPIDTWHAYLRTRLVTTYDTALPAVFYDTAFAFYDRTLYGVTRQRPYWKRCIDETDAALPDPLGKVYVAKEFPSSAKRRAIALVDNLQSTLHDDITTLAWMTPPTRREAERKLAAYLKKIGYPDRWVDFSAVVLAPDATYLDDRFVTAEAATARDVAKIGKPTDRTLWGMSPPTVNAYYNPSNNEIVFPAGILQPPFYSQDADDAVNYGAIGAVIGHEMTHGFDDQGRQYDPNGNLRDWWTPADAKSFNARAQCIVDQFSGYQVQPGAHINGRLVQGEAIADLGGITIAYRAFERTPEFAANVSIDGFTPSQRFFLAYAQMWKELITPAAARQSVLTDPHPENRYRVIGTIGNVEAFAKAFACPIGAAMVRKNRCQIW